VSFSPQGPVLALDVGRKRIGIALAAPPDWLPRGIETLHRTKLNADLAKLSEMARHHHAERIIVGLPLHIDGRRSDMAARVQKFADYLAQETGIPVELRDERLTSVAAEERLSGQGWSQRRMAQERHSGIIDRLAAVILLEDWLRARQEQH
jgi:putative Holliday junction resolvase